MSSIAVGIVHHGESDTMPPQKIAGVEVLTHINANRRLGTPWCGFGRNHNALMERANTSWYVALNPDVRVDLADIRRLVEAADDAGAAIAGPVLASPWGPSGAKRGFPSPSVWLEETVRGAQGREPRDVNGRTMQDSDWVSGACMAIRGNLGLRFDERYFMYFEDADICWRARQRGLKVALCQAVVAEHASGWSTTDRLVWRRGVEFSRSATRFAQVSGSSPLTTRVAGFIRFGSRIFVPARTDAEKLASRSITRGFASPSLPGLAELANEFNGDEQR